MTSRWLVRIACASIALVPMVVASTPPQAPPINGFIFEGVVVRASAGSRANYSVIPLAWHEGRRVNICYGLEDILINRPFTLTSDEGKFYIDFCTCEEPDTLTVAVVSPDTLITGTIIPMESLRGAYEVVGGEYRRGGGGGCSDDNPTTVYYDRGYIFSARNLVINVP